MSHEGVLGWRSRKLAPPHPILRCGACNTALMALHRKDPKDGAVTRIPAAQRRRHWIRRCPSRVYCGENNSPGVHALLFAQAATLSDGEESGSTWAPDGARTATSHGLPPVSAGDYEWTREDYPRHSCSFLVSYSARLGLPLPARISSDIDSTYLSRSVGKAARSLKRGGNPSLIA